MNRFVQLFFALLILTLISCNSSEEKNSEVIMEKPEMVDEELGKLLSSQLAETDTSDILIVAGDSLKATRMVKEFYSVSSYRPRWSTKGRMLPAADTLRKILLQSASYGLIAADYHALPIDSIVSTRYDSTSRRYDVNRLLKSELLLTDAFFKFCIHVSTGRVNPDSLRAEWHPEKLDTNLVQLLNNAISRNSIRKLINSLEPRHEEYQRLKKALNDFLFEFRNESWDSLASRDSDSLTFNDRLRKRLIASHDYVNDTSVSDSMRLVKAIRNFQCRHKLNEDGKVGKLTFKALQRTKTDYIRQIEVNMERWRWQQPPAEERYVWVNIPKYEMKVMEADSIVMTSRVIVGEPDHQTPQLKSTVRYFIIYPFWTVPYSIATKELLPILKRDTSYLRRKNFEVLDRNNMVVDPKTINWKKYSKTYFPWKLRQRIGDENSLGILKFNFENKYGVYLHDTDNRRLFGREMRSLSHGCVRLEKFLDFAQFLIREDSVKYPVDSLHADLLTEKQKYVYVRKPIPIYIRYFSAEADAHGGLYFFIDIYRKDEILKKELYGKSY